MTNLDYLYPGDAAKNFVDENHFVDKNLGFRIIERGTVLPHKHLFAGGKWLWGLGGIVDGRGEFVKESFVYGGEGAAYTPTEDVAQDSSTVVYLGLFYPVWGHCLTDNIRRIWFLQSDIFRTYFKNCRLVYVSWGDGDINTHLQFKRLLEILGVDVDRLWRITRPTRFENIILPDESFFAENNSRKFTAEYRAAIDRVRSFALKNRTPSAKKTYCFYGIRQVGEERLAEYFRGKGYEIFSPEKLTLDLQLNVLINAESFASTLGSCSHNSIFLRDGAETIFIPRIFNQSFEYQRALDQVHPLNVNYVDSSLSIFDSEHGFYCFIVSRQLKEFFGEHFDGYSDNDFRIFLRYAKYLMGKEFGIRSDAEKYYGEVITDFLAQLKRREDLLTAYGVNIS